MKPKTGSTAAPKPSSAAAPKAKPSQSAPDDFLKIRGTDHVEFYVGNAKQAAYYYAHAFGLSAAAYGGLETGLRDRASYVLQQGKVRLVLTAALGPDGPIADHVQRHGDGVRDIALDVEDVDRAWEGTTKRGARSIQEPHDVQDEHGVIRRAAIATYGDTIHSFIDRSNYKGAFLPGYRSTGARVEPGPLLYIDHMVGNVALGDMNRYVAYYRDVMGFSQFQHFDDKDISTEYSALMSKVMADGSGRIKFPINEPAEGKRKSQIEEYLDFYRGPGVQHIALATADIIDTVARLRDSGVAFLTVPPAYYEMLPSRVGTTENIDTLAGLGILVDRDEEGYLLQLFTKPVEDRPTVFYEIIQRKGSRGFGKGNFKALFEAIEREQALRGNL
ncbi:MAG: 4-hydroxyphenylpyruvate dioxygenase [Candidatus Eisenbacteria bacterium]|uniref:4-hydroxyphenylpyruvate dioxygenase n=1 Tax=Eiseniibacteriota bacterium TaxID=2212470 RepID=A0A538TTC5_UNCEI|nr:MAG: 4-hydroxyphenylpyruvate dioxygenase [Candidatus Eisenbacteria bacterium]